MQELSIDSIRAKQGGKARLLVRCLSGLLVINLLTLGIASWARLSRASVAAPEVAEHQQPLPLRQPVNAAVVVAKTTSVPPKVDVPQSTQVKITPSAEKISKAPAPIAVPPVASPVRPIAAPSAEPSVTVPPGDGLEDALASLKKLLASDQGALSGIPFATAAPAPLVIQSTATGPEPRIEVTRELPVQPEQPAAAFLHLVNPRETGGEVHYEVDGVSHSLLPGEYQTIPLGAEHDIEFHRGDNFGDAKLMVREGIYMFGVGRTGWKLEQTQKDLQALLSLAP